MAYKGSSGELFEKEGLKEQKIIRCQLERGGIMEIKTFDISYLQKTKNVLISAFFREGSNEVFNEWEFAETVLKSDAYLPELCVIALDGESVIGYNALTKAEIGDQSGLALGPLGVQKEYQNTGVGSALVKECIRRAAKLGYPWIVLLGGNYYSRFGFESGKPYGITVSDNAFDNDHVQIMFLDEFAKNKTSGKLVYCDAFYDSD